VRTPRELFPPEAAEYVEALAERVEQLEAQLTAAGPPQTPWRTRQQAAEHIPVSLRQFDRLHKEGRITAHYGTGRPLFHIDELDAMVRLFGTLSDHTGSPPLKLARRATERRARRDEP
jgi:hypothetical protein